MLLQISDGGPNDADRDPDPNIRVLNGIVVDPGAPGVVSDNPIRRGGSGASDLWFLLLMLLISTLAIRRTRRLS